MLRFLVSSALATLSAGSIVWEACPPEQIQGVANTWDCATLSFPMDRSDLSKGYVDSFVRRGYHDAPGNKAVFGINGGPGLSTRGFVPMFDHFMTYDASLTSYLVDARGIGMSSPLHNCADYPVFLDPYNASVMQAMDNCNDEMIAADSSRLPYFTTYHAAMDLKGVMDAVNPDTISLFGSSYGTFFANTLLNIAGVEVDVVVLDGPVTNDRWPLENNAKWQSMVALDSISYCVEESGICADHLGSKGHIVSMTKDAIVDGSLPCLSQLPWLAADNGNYLTSLYNNFMNPNLNQALRGPFWYRLYRCSASDVEQLNHFHAARQAFMEAAQPQDPLEYSLGYAVNVGAADTYSEATGSFTPKSYDEVVNLNVGNVVVEGGDLTISFARSVSNWPVPDTNSLSQTYAHPTAPVHIFVGTLDANTPVDQAYWMKDGMSPSSVFVHEVPYAQHGIVDPSNECATDFIVDILSLKPYDYPPSCLETSIPPPDWDGSETATQANSLTWFGTSDLWNNGNIHDATISSSEECDDDDVILIILYILLPVVVLVMLAFIVYLLQKIKRLTEKEALMNGQESSL